MKGILIDSEKREVREVEIKDWRDISPAIGCDLFTVVHMGEDADCYVDDCGLLGQPEHFFLLDTYAQPLAGNGLVLGTDDEGESKDSPLSVKEVEKRIKFMTPTDAHNWVVLHERGLA